MQTTHMIESMDAQTGAIASWTEEAQHRAGSYRFLAAMCNQRPDQALVERLRNLEKENFCDAIVGANAKKGDLYGLQEMHDFIQETISLSDKQVEQMLSIDWTRLFRGVGPGYGPPPPYEGVYLGGDEVKALRAVAHCYHESGLAISESSAERPDYLGLELAYLGYQCEQQAEAWEKGEEERARYFERAEQDFLQNHLGKWGILFCKRATEKSQTSFYRGIVRLIEELIVESTGEGETGEEN